MMRGRVPTEPLPEARLIIQWNPRRKVWEITGRWRNSGFTTEAHTTAEIGQSGMVRLCQVVKAELESQLPF